ncbi:MAG: Ig-like domain-containing domain, partial [Planctomycetota bacterium]
MHASPAHTPPWQAHNGTTPRAALALLLGLALLTPACADGGSSGGGGTAASSASASSAFVVSTSPRDGDFDVPVGHTLELVLSQEVNPATVDAQTVRVERNGVDVGCERIVQGSRIWLKPRIPMLPTTAYRIVATSGIQTFAGDVLETTTIGFTTGPGPNVRGPILMAGAGVADLTPPVGVPVGGYGSRRLPQNQWNFSPQTWHTMFKPSTGVRDPIMAKAVVLDDGVDRIAIVTLDLIASDSRALDDVARKLAARGVQIDRDKIMTCASHTHSGPGAISELYFWMYAALDMYKPALFDQLTTGIAVSIERAVNNLQPAKLGLGLTQLSG